MCPIHRYTTICVKKSCYVLVAEHMFLGLFVLASGSTRSQLFRGSFTSPSIYGVGINAPLGALLPVLATYEAMINPYLNYSTG